MSIESINQGLGRELQCENHDNTISLIRQENNLSNNCISENILHYDLETPTVFSVTCKLMEEFQPHSVPSWHSLFDELQRDIMRENIFQLILQRRSNPSPEWVRNLEDVAKRLEERLYYAASSLEDYQNTRTLVARLESFVKLAALEIPYDEGDSTEGEVGDTDEHQANSVESNSSRRLLNTHGCSRLFIVKVLANVSEFVSGKTLPSISTFPRELVVEWLQKAKETCCTSSLQREEEYYGGPPFLEHDPSTYWTEPDQLYIWWKNNVERKVKYKELQEDAAYGGSDTRRAARARWCAVVVSLVEVIRCSSGISLQSREHIDTAINPNFETMKPEIPGSELSNFGSLLHTLPSLQYPVGTFAPMSRVEGDFSIHSRANSPTPFQNFMSLSSDSRRRLPKPGALHSTNHSNVPMLLLADGVGPTRSNIFPHQKWADDQSYSWKDDSDHSKEALVKKALYKERSDELKASVQLNQKGYQQAFPLKLFDLVTEQNNEIIGWVPEGNAFKVRHMENFVNIILPAYFKHGNFTSFQRQLNLYGFRRTRESDKGAYYHVNFLEGKRELAGTIRRCLSNNHLRDKTSGAESPNLSNPPSVCLPASSPLPAPEIPETVPTQTPRRGTANTKSPKSLSSRAKKVEVVKKSKEPEQYTLDPEPKHEYGTRRKRSKKQFDEFVMSDTSKRKKRGSIHEENDDDVGENEMEYSQQSNTALPIVYVSDIRSSPECDEVIDMTSLPNQRRRLAASRIFIDMTPTLTGRQPTISESQIEINKKRTPLPVSKDENGEIYNTTLSSVSHSKLTRVGDEFQAVIPDLQPQPAITQSLDHDFLCALPDDLNNQWQRAARKKEEIFLASSSSHVIVAVIPCSNSRRIRRSPAPPACILPIKSIRAELLSNQYTSPPECVMSMDLRKTLFPRLCVTLRRLVLIESQFSVVERPVLYFRPEGSDELIESPIWGCDYLQADENSDSETEWSDVHCRGKDIYTMMSNRYQDDQSIFLEVTDGTQNWIVPLAVCASAGSTDSEEFFLQNDHRDLQTILNDDLKVDSFILSAPPCHFQQTPSTKFTPKELEKLGWIDVSMNVFFHQISPLLKRSNENLSRAWKYLQISFDDNPWPSSMKEFVSFCQRYCPHPTDSIATSDSRVVALRRLINMTSEIDAPTFPIERLLENESDKFLLSRYRLPAINSHLAEESADEEDDEEISDTDQPYHASSNNLKHSLLTSVSGDDNNHHEEEVEERF